MRDPLLGFMLIVVGGLPARASETCPSYDDVPARISSAPSCSRAYDVMNACLFNASGDVASARAVEDKCEPLFLAKLSASRRRAYEAARARCVKKYAGREGTMYVSFAATCAAGVTVGYAKKYGRH